MGNRNSSASQPHDKDFGSPDSRGRSWSFHGIKSRKAGSKGAASSFRGRSSSLSDAVTSKGRKGADVVVTVGPGVPIPNGKAASEGPRVAVAPGSVPLRPKWRPGGKGAGDAAWAGGVTVTTTTQDSLAARAHVVVARSDLSEADTRAKGKLTVAGKDGVASEGEKAGQGGGVAAAVGEMSLSGRQARAADTAVVVVSTAASSSCFCFSRTGLT